MTREVAYAVSFVAVLIAGWGIPALAVSALAPSLASSRMVTTNYRGRPVFLGLGLVWVIWSVSLLVVSTAFDLVGSFIGGGYGSMEMLLFDGPLTMPLYAVPFMLTLSAAFFGLADDVFGTSADKGFRGHLRALAGGRLSTGGLKLLGIGAVSAVYGWNAVLMRSTAVGETSVAVQLGWWVLATITIALSANLINLTDLRPGRALKTYSMLAPVAGVVFVLAAVEGFRTFAGEAGVAWTATDTGVTIVCMMVALLGPVAAVWRYDLGEHGMLGDGGSNAMGAIVGYLVAGALPLPWLGAVAAVLLGLNVLSEKVSFSSIIDKTPVLALLDGLGRSNNVTPDDADRGAGVT